jgi:aminoglycoside 3-N-acetyltransferase
MAKTAENVITQASLEKDLEEIGICRGDWLHIKVSLKSIGWIEGGPKTVIDAMLNVLGPEGTLVSDSFIDQYPLPLSPENARKIPDDHTLSNSGAICNAMIKHPEMVRSPHPIHKFTAIGRDAGELMLPHTHETGGYDPLKVMAEAGAKNLTVGPGVVGVGTTHVAQNMLGLKKKPVKAGINFRDAEGKVRTFQVNWVGGCGNGFPKFYPEYDKVGAILKRGLIGEADSILTDMKKTLEVELDVLSKTPEFMLCDDPYCSDCQIKWSFSKGSLPVYALRRGLKLIREKLAR